MIGNVDKEAGLTNDLLIEIWDQRIIKEQLHSFKTEMYLRILVILNFESKMVKKQKFFIYSIKQYLKKPIME